jgi:hypothetical protein
MTSRKPKSYKPCHGEGPDDLSFKVSALLSKGWQLYGEPFMVAFPAPETNGTAAIYCQAIIHSSGMVSEKEGRHKGRSL